jgi:hypothetical protein
MPHRDWQDRRHCIIYDIQAGALAGQNDESGSVSARRRNLGQHIYIDPAQFDLLKKAAQNFG